MDNMSEQEAGFTILEHTADVGVRAWGSSLEEAFEQATHGFLDIVGAWRPGSGERHEIEVTARDPGALLVEWLGEVLYLQDSRDAVICALQVREVGDGSIRGWVELAARPEQIEGTAVKAITYHQLNVERTDRGWEATVFLDI